MTKTYNDIDAVTRLLEEVKVKKKLYAFIMMLEFGVSKTLKKKK